MLRFFFNDSNQYKPALFFSEDLSDNLRNSIRVFELRVFEFLLKYCSRNGIDICWNMSKNVQNDSLREAKTIQHTPMGASKRPHKGHFAKFGFFEAAILYIFGYIPKNAYAIGRNAECQVSECHHNPHVL